jgi:hypothetical protein
LLPESTADDVGPAAEQAPILADLTLIGIVREGGIMRAALFVGRENRLALVEVGDTLGPGRINLIDECGVEIEIDHTVSRLDLVLAAPSGGGS